MAIENFNMGLIKERLDTCKEDNPESVQASQETESSNQNQERLILAETSGTPTDS